LQKTVFEVVLLETRHVKAALSTMNAKTDRRDARGIAQFPRIGWFHPVHCKSPAQKVRALLTAHKLLPAKMRNVELSLRGLLRGYGLKVGEISKDQFATRVRTLTEGHEILERIAGPVSRIATSTRRRSSVLLRAILQRNGPLMKQPGFSSRTESLPLPWAGHAWKRRSLSWRRIGRRALTRTSPTPSGLC
jgi:hypothetical protein